MSRPEIVTAYVRLFAKNNTLFCGRMIRSLFLLLLKAVEWRALAARIRRS